MNNMDKSMSMNLSQSYTLNQSVASTMNVHDNEKYYRSYADVTGDVDDSAAEKPDIFLHNASLLNFSPTTNTQTTSEQKSSSQPHDRARSSSSSSSLSDSASSSGDLSPYGTISSFASYFDEANDDLVLIGKDTGDVVFVRCSSVDAPVDSIVLEALIKKQQQQYQRQKQSGSSHGMPSSGENAPEDTQHISPSGSVDTAAHALAASSSDSKHISSFADILYVKTEKRRILAAKRCATRTGPNAVCAVVHDPGTISFYSDPRAANDSGYEPAPSRPFATYKSRVSGGFLGGLLGSDRDPGDIIRHFQWLPSALHGREERLALATQQQQLLFITEHAIEILIIRPKSQQIITGSNGNGNGYGVGPGMFGAGLPHSGPVGNGTMFSDNSSRASNSSIGYANQSTRRSGPPELNIETTGNDFPPGTPPPRSNRGSQVSVGGRSNGSVYNIGSPTSASKIGPGPPPNWRTSTAGRGPVYPGVKAAAPKPSAGPYHSLIQQRVGDNRPPVVMQQRISFRVSHCSYDRVSGTLLCINASRGREIHCFALSRSLDTNGYKQYKQLAHMMGMNTPQGKTTGRLGETQSSHSAGFDPDTRAQSVRYSMMPAELRGSAGERSRTNSRVSALYPSLPTTQLNSLSRGREGSPDQLLRQSSASELMVLSGMTAAAAASGQGGSGLSSRSISSASTRAVVSKESFGRFVTHKLTPYAVLRHSQFCPKYVLDKLGSTGRDMLGESTPLSVTVLPLTIYGQLHVACLMTESLELDRAQQQRQEADDADLSPNVCYVAIYRLTCLMTDAEREKEKPASDRRENTGGNTSSAKNNKNSDNFWVLEAMASIENANNAALADRTKFKLTHVIPLPLHRRGTGCRYSVQVLDNLLVLNRTHSRSGGPGLSFVYDLNIKFPLAPLPEQNPDTETHASRSINNLRKLRFRYTRWWEGERNRTVYTHKCGGSFETSSSDSRPSGKHTVRLMLEPLCAVEIGTAQPEQPLQYHFDPNNGQPSATPTRPKADVEFFNGSSPVVLDRAMGTVRLLEADPIAIARHRMNPVAPATLEFFCNRQDLSAKVAATALIHRAMSRLEPQSNVGTLLDVVCQVEESALGRTSGQHFSTGVHSASVFSGEQGIMRQTVNMVAGDGRFHMRRAMPPSSSSIVGVTSAAATSTVVAALGTWWLPDQQAAQGQRPGLFLPPKTGQQLSAFRYIHSLIQQADTGPTGLQLRIPQSLLITECLRPLLLRLQAQEAMLKKWRLKLQAVGGLYGNQKGDKVKQKTSQVNIVGDEILDHVSDDAEEQPAQSTSAADLENNLFVKYSNRAVDRMIMSIANQRKQQHKSSSSAAAAVPPESNRDQQLMDYDDQLSTLHRAQGHHSLALRYMRAVVQEYARAVTVEETSQAPPASSDLHLLMLTLCSMGEPTPDYFALHKLFMYRVMPDSVPIAYVLLQKSTVYPPAFQLAVDMFSRLGRYEDLVRALLDRGMVLRALQAAVTHRVTQVPAWEMLSKAADIDDAAALQMERGGYNPSQKDASLIQDLDTFNGQPLVTVTNIKPINFYGKRRAEAETKHYQPRAVFPTVYQALRPQLESLSDPEEVERYRPFARRYAANVKIGKNISRYLISS